ncbi:microprocessor complex subunit partner of drosha [Rhodnius prolixus]
MPSDNKHLGSAKMDQRDVSSGGNEGRGVKRKCPFATKETDLRSSQARVDGLEEGELVEENSSGRVKAEETAFSAKQSAALWLEQSEQVGQQPTSHTEQVNGQTTFQLEQDNQPTSQIEHINDQISSQNELDQFPSRNEHLNDQTSCSEVNTDTVAQTEQVNGSDDHLRVFHVLSEYDGASETEANKDENTSDSDISDEEIEAMLEEGLKNKEKTTEEPLKDGQQKPVQYTEKKLVMLEEIGINHFDLLPEGWVQITHKSGMPLYLHRASRVCTFSRPYYLGQGSARKHLVPLSAIPCLQYKRALEEEKKNKEEESNPSTAPIWLRPAKIETAEENKLAQSLGPFAIQQYCKTLFRFKIAQSLRFVSWSDRRRYAKAKKIEKQQRPTFPNDTKLIKFPILNPNDGPEAKPREEWIMNPNGKSYICILHEYVQHALKMQPTYEFKALENPSTPYSATVIISGMKYGYGTGTSKKQAKLAAAKASLEILIPQMREKIRNDSKQGKKCRTDDDEASLSIFDEIKIEDPRVTEFCTKTTEPPPYSILLTCLQRNFDMDEMAIEYKVNSLHRQSNEFIMSVGSHTARVVCKKKKEGKQRASQALLQKLHPHITSWGSLLRLYGNRSLRNVKEKKQEEQEITMLQSKASLNSPNYAILGKLKTEMMKLHDEMAKRKPISIFVPPPDIVLPSSGTQLNKIDL